MQFLLQLHQCLLLGVGGEKEPALGVVNFYVVLNILDLSIHHVTS